MGAPAIQIGDANAPTPVETLFYSAEPIVVPSNQPAADRWQWTLPANRLRDGDGMLIEMGVDFVCSAPVPCYLLIGGFQVPLGTLNVGFALLTVHFSPSRTNKIQFIESILEPFPGSLNTYMSALDLSINQPVSLVIGTNSGDVVTVRRVSVTKRRAVGV